MEQGQYQLNPIEPGVVDDVPGWFEPESAELYDWIVEQAPHGALLVEVGVFCGKSLIHLARSAKYANKNLRVVGVDTFAGSPEFALPEMGSTEWGTLSDAPVGHWAQCAMTSLHAYGLDDYVSLLVCDSVRAAKLLQDPWFVFLDADHTPEAVTRDIAAWRGRVVDGGYLAGHDYNWPGMRETIRECFGADAPSGISPNCWMVRINNSL